MTLEEEKLLVEGVINNEENSIRLFLETYKNIVYSTIHGFSFAQDYGVDDYYQEFMVRLMDKDWRRLSLWEGNCRLSTYLVSILINFLKDETRKKRDAYQINSPMEDESALDNMGEDPSDDIEANIYIEMLRACCQEYLKSFSDQDREIFNMVFIKDEDADEASDALGMTKGAYYTAFHRLKKRLKEGLEEEYHFLFEPFKDDV